MRLTVLSLLLLPLGAGCGLSATEDQAIAEQGALSADSATADTSLSAAATDGLQAGDMVSVESAAAAAAGRAGTYLQPPGCVTAQAVGAVVTYTLKDCTGPHGMVHLTGTVTATFSAVSASGATVAIAAHGLQANDAVFDVAATSVITISGTVRSAAVTTQSSASSSRGSLSRSGSYVASWDGSCLSLSGSWETAVAGSGGGAGAWTTSVSGYHRCQSACPDAGGSVTLTGSRGRSVTVTFNGTDAPTWTTSGGRSGTIDLACG